jgi:hypothetical protein
LDPSAKETEDLAQDEYDVALVEGSVNLDIREDHACERINRRGPCRGDRRLRFAVEPSPAKRDRFG